METTTQTDQTLLDSIESYVHQHGFNTERLQDSVLIFIPYAHSDDFLTEEVRTAGETRKALGY